MMTGPGSGDAWGNPGQGDFGSVVRGGVMAGEMEGLTLADVQGGKAVRAAGRVVPLEDRAGYWLQGYLGQVRPKWVLGNP